MPTGTTIVACAEELGVLAAQPPPESCPVFEKDPLAIKDYFVDWTEVMDSGDSLVSIDASVEAGLTISHSFILGKRSYSWVSGGAVGLEYAVTHVVTTAFGETYAREILLRVRYT